MRPEDVIEILPLWPKIERDARPVPQIVEDTETEASEICLLAQIPSAREQEEGRVIYFKWPPNLAALLQLEGRVQPLQVPRKPSCNRVLAFA